MAQIYFTKQRNAEILVFRTEKQQIYHISGIYCKWNTGFTAVKILALFYFLVCFMLSQGDKIFSEILNIRPRQSFSKTL